MLTIHVIITLLMLKSATSQTCYDFSGDTPSWCSQNNEYLTNVRLTVGRVTGRCCEADDPSYANQPVKCLRKLVWSRRYRQLIYSSKIGLFECFSDVS